MSKIQLVVITWNSLPYIKETLPPLLKQEFPDIEYVYVDNGSSDGTVEYIKSEIDKNKGKNIKLIENKENLGLSIAKNQGVEASSGEYILLLDDDMLIENRDFVSNIAQYYTTLNNPAFLMPFFLDQEELESGLTMTYGTYYYTFGVKKKKKRINYQKILNYKKEIPIAIAQGGAMFIKRSIWDDLGGFDESQKFNLDDDDISTRALVYGYNNYLHNKEYIVHLGLSKRKDPKRYAWNDRTYYSGKAKSILKNFSLSTSIWMLPLFTVRAVVEAIYHSLQMKHVNIFMSNIYSIFVFLKDLPDTLRKRNIIQKNRKVSDRKILQLHQPEYES